MAVKDAIFKITVRLLAFLKKDLDVSRQKMLYSANMRKDAREMDRDQLGALIRYHSHSLDKAVRCENKSVGRGQERKRLLKEAVDEWTRRGYEMGPDKLWAKEVLEEFDRWRLGSARLARPVGSPNPASTDTGLFSAIENRRSVRFWKKKMVERDKIEEIIRAATYAPSSCNRMAWRFFIVENDIGRVVDGDSTNKSMVEKAPVRIYIGIDQRLYPEIYAPAMDAGFALQNLVLSAHALGLGTCLMYQAESIDQAKFKAELNIPDYYMIYCAVMLGYPDELPSTPARVDAKEVCTFVDKAHGSAGRDCFAR